jgi:SNF2 family DNA or RNA helicase
MKVTKWGSDMAIQGLPENHFYHETVRKLGKRRWFPAQKVWVMPAWLSIMEDVKKWMPALEWDQDINEVYFKEVADEQRRQEMANGNYVIPDNAFAGVNFKTTPYAHQKVALYLGRDLTEFAYLMDQGTGKTKTIIDDVAHNYRNGRINAFLIISPNSVKTNWVDCDEDEKNPDQITVHMPDDVPVIKASYFSNPSRTQQAALDKVFKAINLKSQALVILSLNVESLYLERVQKMLQEYCHKRDVFCAIDESTRIGRHSAKRSKVAHNLRKVTKVRRIASGTPVIKSPLKAYSQFYFLNPNIMGIPTFTEFQARYAIVRGQHNTPVSYTNLDELRSKIAGCSYRVTKEQCLDLPPKVYVKRMIPLTPEQNRLYQQMRREAIVAIQKTQRMVDGHVYIEATNVMVQMLRLQQIVAGYLPLIDEDTGKQSGVIKIGNSMPPKIEETLDLMESCEDEKVIIWCKFKFEVREMCDALARAGITYVKFDGDTSEQERIHARQAFQSDPALRCFVGQIQTGGIGLNLFAASQVVYLSNPFATEDRVQSEDRAHRIGQTRSVTYTDLISPKTIDERVLDVLRANKRVSEMVLGDTYQDWI